MARISAPSTSPEAQTPKSYIFIQAHRLWADLFLVFPRVKSPVLDQALAKCLPRPGVLLGKVLTILLHWNPTLYLQGIRCSYGLRPRWYSS